LIHQSFPLPIDPGSLGRILFIAKIDPIALCFKYNMSETIFNHGLLHEQSDESTEQLSSTVALGYGARHVHFKFDPNQFQVLVPQYSDAVRLSDGEINAALDVPIATPRLEEIVKPSERVIIVAPDATRAAGVDRIAPLIVERLNRLGLRDDQISVLIGGGTHRAPTSAEIQSILGPALPLRIVVYSHDANDASSHVSLGKTSRGTPVLLNRRLLENDHVIVLGAITYHYIAGFSGGRKAILPGCAARSSIQSTHLLSFDRNTLEKSPGVASGCLDGNPVHEDMTEAVELLNPSFLVNTVLGKEGDVVAVYAGHWRQAHRQGCEDYAKAHRVPVTERRPLVIVSAGGAPRDINLIQSHKAMEHASAVLEDEGAMIVLAECAEGLGLVDFLRWFVPGGSRATAQMLVEDYKIYGQTAWSLRRKAERFRIMLISSINSEMTRLMGIEPHQSLRSALAGVSKQNGYIIPNGLATLPTLS